MASSRPGVGSFRWTLISVLALGSTAIAQQSYTWQESQARVVETGDLQWAPLPFKFEAGKDVRYIDFDGGSDQNDGRSRDRAWKHHPWDKAAGANSKGGSGDTFIFKRGVVYRGALSGANQGEGIVRLTSDPSWGNGDAIIAGSQIVSGWQLGGDTRMPQANKVWSTRIDFAPRRVWIRQKDGTLTRLTLARTPNWKPDNIDDLRAGWYEWEQPEWWTNKNVMTVNGTKMHLGIDRKHLTADPETYKDALVWSEYGIVMGSPFASKIEAYDPQKKGVAFRGPWGGGDDEKIITGNRYFLEDKPQFLDEPGEFWFNQQSKTLYVRLPGDADPNTAQVEAARFSTLLEAGRFDNLRITGLTFQCGNTFYDLTARPFVHKDVESAAIKLLGSGDNVVISHCRFEQLTGGIRIKAEADTDRVGLVQITDSQFSDLDRSCIDARDGGRWGKSDGEFGSLRRVEIMRNRIERIGWRGGRDCHGHTLQIGFADTAEVAGNIINQVGGAGIFVFGGKGSGEMRDKPLSRVLIHHNKVTDSLLLTNDWGGIETWQGGPHYLWSNISYNPNGYWNWAFLNNTRNKPADKVDWGAARQGFAYYFDGSFKNYVFNNIAAGKNNQTGSPLCNASAFQECIGFQNAFFNNTAYNFAVGLRRQSPRAGRDKWLGNIMDSMSVWNFLAAEPKEGAPKDANAFQFSDFKGTNYATETNAYSDNVFHGKPRYFGVFEEDGSVYRDLAAFAKAQKMHKAQESDVGVMSAAPLLANPGKGDYRPAANAALAGKGAKVFVPWGLYACVGEWNFIQNQKDPTIAIDDGWYMTKYYVDREKNWMTPRHALTGVNITADDYVQGPMDGWAKGAVRLDGKKYFVAKHEDLVKPFEYDVGKKKLMAQGLDIASPQIGEGNFLIEIYFRSREGQGAGALVSKVSGNGYELNLNTSGGVDFILRPQAGVVSVSGGKVSDGKWHHLIAAVDRKAGILTLYQDGRLITSGGGQGPFAGSLENTGDFIVGKGFAGEIDFLRVCRGTLADARTTIEELYAWEFDGPQFRDFTGRKSVEGKRVAGAIDAR